MVMSKSQGEDGRGDSGNVRRKRLRKVAAKPAVSDSKISDDIEDSEEDVMHGEMVDNSSDGEAESDDWKSGGHTDKKNKQQAKVKETNTLLRYAKANVSNVAVPQEEEEGFISVPRRLSMVVEGRQEVPVVPDSDEDVPVLFTRPSGGRRRLVKVAEAQHVKESAPLVEHTRPRRNLKAKNYNESSDDEELEGFFSAARDVHDDKEPSTKPRKGGRNDVEGDKREAVGNAMPDLNMFSFGSRVLSGSGGVKRKAAASERIQRRESAKQKRMNGKGGKGRSKVSGSEEDDISCKVEHTSRRQSTRISNKGPAVSMKLPSDDEDFDDQDEFDETEAESDGNLEGEKESPTSSDDSTTGADEEEGTSEGDACTETFKSEENQQFKVEKVLSARSVKGGKEYLIKELHRSYRKVRWVTEASLQGRCPQLLRNFNKNLSLMGRQEGHLQEKEDDPAYDPRYEDVERVIGERTKGRIKELEYLVKWHGLPYGESTWESKAELENEDAAILQYNERNKVAAFRRNTAPLRTSFDDGRKLREYQEKGLEWLDSQFKAGVNSILADEMGLGKTIQSVAMLENVKSRMARPGPCLVVAPVSTLGHWQREIQTLTTLNCVLYTGNANDRSVIQQYEFHSTKRRYKFDVLLTSFEILLKDKGLLSPPTWSYMIVDEAHRLKGTTSKSTVALKELKVARGGMLLLTGTPVQNNMGELFGLLNVLDPDNFLSEEAFMAEYGNMTDSNQVKQLQEKVLRPRLLRRMKEDVESIPQKEEIIVWVQLTREQREYYKAIFENKIDVLLKGAKSSNMPNLRNVAMELRKICNHPYLCDGLAEDMVSKRLRESTGENHTEVEERLLIQSSGKMVLLDKLLPMLKSAGHRVLIFSQFVIMLNILEDFLNMMGYQFERIDGSTKGADRQAAIDRYSREGSEKFVFLLSTRAGGLGITLTAADTCIIYDSDWNPQNDLQAMARCHRIGQTKDVKIYRFITSNTYEQRLFESSSRKYGLDEAILGDQLGSARDPEQGRDIESLLKNGAYDILKDDDAGEAAAFSSENIHQILEQRTQKRLIGGSGHSSFSVATFRAEESEAKPAEQNPADSGNFWQELLPEACKQAAAKGLRSPGMHMSGPRRKKDVNYNEKQFFAKLAESDDSDYEEEDRVSSDKDEDQDACGVKPWSDAELKRLEDNLMVLGPGRTEQIAIQASISKRSLEEIEAVSKTLVELCHYMNRSRDSKSSVTREASISPGAQPTTIVPSTPSAMRTPGGAALVADTSSPPTGGPSSVTSDLPVPAAEESRPEAPVYARRAMEHPKFLDRIQRKCDKYLQLLHERRVLEDSMPLIRSGALPTVSERSRMPNWWTEAHDRDFLIGVHQHGHKAFDKIRDDPAFLFAGLLKSPAAYKSQFEQDKDNAGVGSFIFSFQGNVLPMYVWPSDHTLTVWLKTLVESLPNGISAAEAARKAAENEKKALKAEAARMKRQNKLLEERKAAREARQRDNESRAQQLNLRPIYSPLDVTSEHDRPELFQQNSYPGHTNDLKQRQSGLQDMPSTTAYVPQRSQLTRVASGSAPGTAVTPDRDIELSPGRVNEPHPLLQRGWPLGSQSLHVSPDYSPGGCYGNNASSSSNGPRPEGQPTAWVGGGVNRICTSSGQLNKMQEGSSPQAPIAMSEVQFRSECLGTGMRQSTGHGATPPSKVFPAGPSAGGTQPRDVFPSSRSPPSTTSPPSANHLPSSPVGPPQTSESHLPQASQPRLWTTPPTGQNKSGVVTKQKTLSAYFFGKPPSK